LTVKGAHFVNGAAVTVNGTNLGKSTVFASAAQLTVPVPASLVKAVGSESVTVTNPDGQKSGAINLVVQVPPTEVTSRVRAYAPLRLLPQADGSLTGFITVVNSTGSPIAGPITIVLHALPPGVALLNATGTDSGGDRFLTLTSSSAIPLVAQVPLRVPVTFSNTMGQYDATIFKSFPIRVFSGSFGNGPASPQAAVKAAAQQAAVEVQYLTQVSTWVGNLYLNVLHRSASVSEAGFWTQLVVQGQLSRDQVVSGLLASDEARIDVITGYYSQYLNRGVDLLALQYWLGYLAQGGSQEGIQEALLSSPEFYQVQGGTDRSYVQALFHLLLNRSATSQDATSLTAVLDGSSADAVVRDVLFSAEYETDLVASLYASYLGRPADAAGLSSFVSLLRRGAPPEQVEFDLLSSEEYFQKAG
jgi:hypothetical protein